MCIGNGDAFGQDFYADSKLGKALADVRALSYCDLTYIHRDDLIDTFRMYPDFGPKFSANLNISYDLRVDVSQSFDKSLNDLIMFVQGRTTKQDRKSSPFHRRRIATVKEVDETVSLDSDGRQQLPEIRVTFELGDTDMDLVSEPSNAMIHVATSREPSQTSQSDVVEACDLGVADEVHSVLVQHQKLEVKESPNFELQEHIHRLEHRLMKLEVSLNKVVELLERPSVSGLLYDETSL